MSLNAGRLNRRIQILQRSASQDGAGQPVETWSTLATLWADVKAPSGSATAERVDANAEVSTAAYSVRIRYRSDITAGMRASIGGVTMDIAQVVVDHAMREYVDLVCIAGAI